MGILLGIIVLAVSFLLFVGFSVDKDMAAKDAEEHVRTQKRMEEANQAQEDIIKCHQYIENELHKSPDFDLFWQNYKGVFITNGEVLGFPNMKYASMYTWTKFREKQEGFSLGISVVGKNVYFFPTLNNAFVRRNDENTDNFDYKDYYVIDYSCKYPIKPLIVPMSDILYFCETGEELIYTTVSGGNTNIHKGGAAKGAVIGGVVGGQIGAGVGAVLGSGIGQTSPVKTTVHKDGTKQLKLFLRLDGTTVGLNFTTAEAKYDIKKLLEIMPEKNISWIQGHQTEKQEQASTADELLKFKNLLDQGVITQEEFDKKKTQLLGN